MPTAISERASTHHSEPSAGIATVWLVLYVVLGLVALTNSPISSMVDVSMLF